MGRAQLLRRRSRARLRRRQPLLQTPGCAAGRRRCSLGVAVRVISACLQQQTCRQITCAHQPGRDLDSQRHTIHIIRRRRGLAFASSHAIPHVHTYFHLSNSSIILTCLFGCCYQLHRALCRLSHLSVSRSSLSRRQVRARLGGRSIGGRLRCRQPRGRGGGCRRRRCRLVSQPAASAAACPSCAGGTLIVIVKICREQQRQSTSQLAQEPAPHLKKYSRQWVCSAQLGQCTTIIRTCLRPGGVVLACCYYPNLPILARLAFVSCAAASRCSTRSVPARAAASAARASCSAAAASAAWRLRVSSARRSSRRSAASASACWVVSAAARSSAAAAAAWPCRGGTSGVALGQ